MGTLPAISRCDTAKFARDILAGIGLIQPPVSAEIVADHLGLEIKEFTNAQIQQFLDTHDQNDPEGRQIYDNLMIACAWLEKYTDGNAIIRLRKELPESRKRMAIFHECAHFIIPWHDGVNYFSIDHPVDLTTMKQYEREAFNCAAEFMMPAKMFIEDLRKFDIGFEAIQVLTQIYDASREATAIRYTQLHHGKCILLMLEPTRNKRYPFQVKYSSKSRLFLHTIGHGVRVKENTPVVKAWAEQSPVKTEVTLSIFAGGKNASGAIYNAECLPIKQTGNVMMLMWR